MEFTNFLSFYGAITGTIAIVFSAIGAYNNLKDRPWLKIRYRVVRPNTESKKQTTKRVIVDLSNIGRRRALAYPPNVEYVTVVSSWVRLIQHSPNAEWIDGFNWKPIPDTGELPVLNKIEEYDTYSYSYTIPSCAKIIRICVIDSLERQKSKYSFCGFYRLNLFRLKRLLNPSKFRT